MPDYFYYPSGLRSAKMDIKGTTTFVLDGGDVALELRGTTLAGKYVRGAGLITSAIGGADNWYMHNAHGDVAQLTNSHGSVTRSYSYDAFGVERTPVAGDNNPFRYCGEYFDKETGTYYLRARH